MRGVAASVLPLAEIAIVPAVCWCGHDLEHHVMGSFQRTDGVTFCSDCVDYNLYLPINDEEAGYATWRDPVHYFDTVMPTDQCEMCEHLRVRHSVDRGHGSCASCEALGEQRVFDPMHVYTG